MASMKTAVPSLADEALRRLLDHREGGGGAAAVAPPLRSVLCIPDLPSPPPQRPRSSLLEATKTGSEGSSPRNLLLLASPVKTSVLTLTSRLPPPPPGVSEAVWRATSARAAKIPTPDPWRGTRRLEAVARAHRGLVRQLRAHRVAAAATRCQQVEAQQARIAATAAAADDATIFGRLEKMCQRVVQSINTTSSWHGSVSKQGAMRPRQWGSSLHGRASGSRRPRLSSGSVVDNRAIADRRRVSSGGSAAGMAMMPVLAEASSNSRGTAAMSPLSPMPAGAVTGGFPQNTAAQADAQAPRMVHRLRTPHPGAWAMERWRQRQQARMQQQQGTSQGAATTALQLASTPLSACSAAGTKAAATAASVLQPIGKSENSAASRAARIAAYRACVAQRRANMLGAALAELEAAAVARGDPRPAHLSTRGSKATAGGSTAASADEATTDLQLPVKQLVTVLVRADLGVLGGDGAGAANGAGEVQQQLGKSPRLRREALRLQLAAARTVAELAQAANEHTQEVANELEQQQERARQLQRQLQQRERCEWQRRREVERQRQGLALVEDTAVIEARRVSQATSVGDVPVPAELMDAPSLVSVSQQSQAALSSSAASTLGLNGAVQIPAVLPTATEFGSRPSPPAAGPAGPSCSGACEDSAAVSAFENAPPLAPSLEQPTPEELAAVPSPSLPSLILPVGVSPAGALQARLERVWDILAVPASARMSTVLRLTTNPTAAFGFEALLIAWESCAAAVLQREGLLQRLKQLREATVASAKAQRAAADARARAARRASALAASVGCRISASDTSQLAVCRRPSDASTIAPAGEPLLGYALDGDVGASMPSSIGYTFEEVTHLMWAFQVASCQVAEADAALQIASGGAERLTLGGQQYPLGALGRADLEMLLHQAHEVLQAQPVNA